MNLFYIYHMISKGWSRVYISADERQTNFFFITKFHLNGYREYRTMSVQIHGFRELFSVVAEPKFIIPFRFHQLSG